jgi:integrase
MPRRQLTDRFCAHAKAAEGQVQTDFFDAATTGLTLRVSRSGRKAWTYHFTWASRSARMTLGTYPATSLAGARTLADEARAALEAGNDPRSTRREPDTVWGVCEEWFAREGTALRTGANRQGILARLVYPALGDRALAEVRRSDIIRLLDQIADRNGPVMADHTLAYLRRVFTWYASRSDEFRSPIVRGMARTRPKERARERTLKDEELRVIWSVAERQGGAYARMVRFILLTGARRAEVAAMQWSEVSGSDWTLPASRNKTKVDLVRPLSASALAVLPSRAGAFIFSIDGENAFGSFSYFKRAFDRAVTAELGAALPRWTLHDLRRTARSLMSRAGVSADHAERCLGHVIGGVRGTYDRHGYHEEKRRAFEALAAMIERVLSPPGDNVVQMRTEANG